MVHTKSDLHDRIIEVYSSYPRKMGKSAGLKKAIAQIKTIEAADSLNVAIINYRNYISRMGTEWQYIMYFSTFMGQWEDWLDPEIYGPGGPHKPDLSGAGFEK